MKGNFTTEEGGYEDQRKRRLSRLDSPQAVDSQEPHAGHIPPNPGSGVTGRKVIKKPVYSRSTRTSTSGTQSLAPVTPLSSGSNHSRTRISNTHRSNGKTKRNGRRRLSSIGQGPPAFPEQSSQPGPRETGTCPQDIPFDQALWVSSPEGFNDAEPLATFYDQESDSSLIKISAVGRLKLKRMVYPPGMNVSIMTKSGLVYPTHFVRVLVEARWLRNGKLGTRHITVVSDDLLEPYGKDLLAGKKIIDQLRVMSGMVLYPAGNVRDSGPRGLSQPRTCPSLARLSGKLSTLSWARYLLKTSSILARCRRRHGTVSQHF